MIILITFSLPSPPSSFSTFWWTPGSASNYALSSTGPCSQRTHEKDTLLCPLLTLALRGLMRRTRVFVLRQTISLPCTRQLSCLLEILWKLSADRTRKLSLAVHILLFLDVLWCMSRTRVFVLYWPQLSEDSWAGGHISVSSTTRKRDLINLNHVSHLCGLILLSTMCELSTEKKTLKIIFYQDQLNYNIII